MLGHFSPQIQGEHGFAGPEVWHSAVAQFYDVVHLRCVLSSDPPVTVSRSQSALRSVKGLLYEDYLMNPQKVRQSYYLDPILANSKGHELLADTLIAYLESEICQVWDQAALETDLAALAGGKQAAPLALGDDYPSLLSGKGLRKAADAGLDADDAELAAAGGRGRSGYLRIPPFRITDRPHSLSQFREIKPNCASANDLINPLPQSVFAGSGWKPVQPKPDDEDEMHYWYTDMPGSLLKIPIKVGAGDIAVYYLKGPEAEGWGTVLCWVDDNVDGAMELKGHWDREYGQPTCVFFLLVCLTAVHLADLSVRDAVSPRSTRTSRRAPIMSSASSRASRVSTTPASSFSVSLRPEQSVNGGGVSREEQLDLVGSRIDKIGG